MILLLVLNIMDDSRQLGSTVGKHAEPPLPAESTSDELPTVYEIGRTRFDGLN